MPTDEFRAATQRNSAACASARRRWEIEASLSVGLARARKSGLGELSELELSELYTTIDACQKKAKAEVKKLFPKANAAVANKPTASNLLKDYYAAWLSALDGITPDANERKVDYDNRQGEASRKADAIWNRFEIEAGL